MFKSYEDYCKEAADCCVCCSPVCVQDLDDDEWGDDDDEWDDDDD